MYGAPVSVLARQDVALTDPCGHFSGNTVRQEAALSEPKWIDPRPDERHGLPMSARFGGRVTVARGGGERGAATDERVGVGPRQSAVNPPRVVAVDVAAPPALNRACKP